MRFKPIERIEFYLAYEDFSRVWDAESSVLAFLKINLVELVS